MVKPPQKNEMPDVAQSDFASHATTLDWVGMNKISLPLQVPVNFDNKEPAIQQVGAEVGVFVNLSDPKAKGIHMSRLYLLLAEYAESQVFSPSSFAEFAQKLLASHEDISDMVRVQVSFPLMLNRKALKSQFSGYKSYPCEVEMRLVNNEVKIVSTVKVAYSSTCPCSAALARQLLQQEFSKDFDGQASIDKETIEAWLRSPKGSFATPHSQRSEAYVQVLLDNNSEFFQFVDLINNIESSLGTPVQTAVKREDEQEFAKLNGQNLMFCEDAARRIHNGLTAQNFPDFRAKVSHYESLHAHDAVSMTSKGVPGGLSW